MRLSINQLSEITGLDRRTITQPRGLTMNDRYAPQNAPLPRLNPRTGQPWKPGKDRIAQIYRDGQAETHEVTCKKAYVDRQAG